MLNPPPLGTEPGDGIFTARTDIVYTADRAYVPHQQVYNSYGPLSSFQKFYSFGYQSYQTLLFQNPVTATSVNMSLPVEGSCIITMSLNSSSTVDYDEKLVLSHRFLFPLSEEWEVNIKILRTAVSDATVQFATETLLQQIWRFARWTVMSLQQSRVTSPEAFEAIIESLDRPLADVKEEIRACVLVIEQCKAQVDRLSKQLKDLQELMSWEEKVDPMRPRNKRLAMIAILLQGEFLTLQAIAEYFMSSLQE